MTMKWVMTATFLMLTGASIVLAQSSTATILGEVKDASGGVLPGVALSARNTDTGQTRTTVAAENGRYRFDAVPVGNYEVRAELLGFSTEIRSGLTLSVTQEAVVNFVMRIGALEESIVVAGEAPIVNVTNGTLGGLVSEEQIADLPLNGRNYTSLALLQSGITELKTKPSSTSVLASSGTFFSSNGAPPRSNTYLLDGTSLTAYGGGNGASISGSTLGLDGIREFRIVTNAFPAEYGMNMGSQMVMVSKSGANAVHGSAFEYARNSALDAPNYFDTPASSGKTDSGEQRRLPPLKRNNFGGSFGGPIKKDKAFFFAVYEGLREHAGSSFLINTIPAGCRGAAGATITNTACPALGTTASVQVAPVVQPWLALYPQANTGTNQLSWGFDQPTREDYAQVRIDHTFSARDSLFGRFTTDNTKMKVAGTFPVYDSSPESKSRFLTLTENHIFSPSLLNTARLSLSHSDILIGVTEHVTGPGFSFAPGSPMGTVNITGVTALTAGGTATSHGKQDVLAFNEDLFYTRGHHSLKFGTLINRYQVTAQNGVNINGTITFPNMAAFLTARPSNWTIIQPPYANSKTVNYSTFGFYAQDDLRASSRLTFNLGLRYEFNTDPDEIDGNQSAIRDLAHDTFATLGPMTTNPSHKNFGPRLGFAWDVTGDGKTAVRGGFGILYNIAGWLGIMHQAFRTPPFENQITVTNPATLTTPFTFPETAAALSTRSPSTFDYNMKQARLHQYNLAVQRQLPFDTALTVAYGGSRGYNLTVFTEGNPIIPLGVPSVLANGLKTCVARPAGSTPPANYQEMSMVEESANACWLGTESRINPNWGTVNTLISPRGQSWYNSLQVGMDKRLAHGLQFQSNLTWSRLLDTSQCQSNGDTGAAGPCAVMDPLNPSLDKAPASFDVPWSWRLNVLYRLPGNNGSGFAGKALNGWWMSSVFQFQSGYPFSPTLTQSRSRALVLGNTGATDRLNVVAGRNPGNITSGTTAGCQGVAAGQALGTAALYYDPCAFSIQSAGFFGNEPRSYLRGPDYKTVDLSIGKDSKLGFLGPAGAIQFRAEIFNLLNRTNFGLPNRAVFVGNGPATGDVESPISGAGTITSAGPARQVQLALKILF